MRRLGLLLGLGVALLAACVSNNPPPKDRTPQAAAANNMQLALEYMRLGKLAIARDFIEKALTEDPHSAQVQATAGLVYEQLLDMPKAEHAFAAAERIGRKDPTIQNSYAGFLCRTHKVAEGEKLFLKVSRDPLYLTPEVAIVNAGVCVHSAGDNITAEKYFHQALTVHPNMGEALLQLGNLLLERGDAQEALTTVQRFETYNAPTPDILWLGLRTERKLGDETSAGAYARRLQTEFPASEQARMLQSGLAR
jgi:type IV pilus assembly protein PilF